MDLVTLARLAAHVRTLPAGAIVPAGISRGDGCLTVTLKISPEAERLLVETLRTAGVELPPLPLESGDGRER
jgi:hypothetical protein